MDYKRGNDTEKNGLMASGKIIISTVSTVSTNILYKNYYQYLYKQKKETNPYIPAYRAHMPTVTHRETVSLYRVAELMSSWIQYPHSFQ